MRLSLLCLAAVCLHGATVIAAPISDNVVSEDKSAVRDIHMPKDTSYVDFSGMGFLQKRTEHDVKRKRNKNITTIIKYMTKHKKLKTTLTLAVNGRPRKNVFTTTLKHNNRKHGKKSTTKARKSKKKHTNNSKRQSNKHKQKDSSASKDYPNAGKGTFFAPNRGSCGWKNTKNDLIVAVNAKDMANKKHKSDENPNCGRMVEIVNASGDKVKAQVADTCPECSKGDLDLSPAAFIKLAPFKQGIVKIRWRYM
ncbi:hypothetical protein PS15p_203074 [Mucor circinelloides]